MIFRKPSPLSVAALQLEDAKRELLMAEAAAEDFKYHFQSEECRASALRSRITRLTSTIAALAKERDETNPS